MLWASLPPIFLLKIPFAPLGTSRTSFELLVSCFLPQDLRALLVELSGSRSQSISKEDSGRRFRQPICQLYSGRHTHQSRSFLVSFHSCRTPFSQRCDRQCRPSIFRHACVFGKTIEQALTVSDQVEWASAPPPIRPSKLFLQSQPHTTLLACILPGPKNLDMR